MTQSGWLWACALCWLSTCCLNIAQAQGAGDPRGPQWPWRPFPELPEVLFFEGFEGVTHHAGKGTLVEERAVLPGKKSYRFGMQRKSLIVNFDLGNASFPNGLHPNQIHLQLMLYTEATGTLTIKYNAGQAGEYSDKIAVTKARQWLPILTQLSRARNGRLYARPEHTLSHIQISLSRPNQAIAASAYIDNLCITHGVKAQWVMPRILARMRQIAEVARSHFQDGFSYSVESRDRLKAALKNAPRRKARQVLCFPDTRQGGAELHRALAAAALKAGAAGLHFVPAAAPDNSAVGGLDDFRTLLLYNIAQSSPEFVVVLFNGDEAAIAGRRYEPAAVALERALEAGSVPIVCLAPGSNSDAFNAGLQRVCAGLGIVCIDSERVLKDELGKEPARPAPRGRKVKRGKAKAPAPARSTELNAAALQKLAPVIISALRHVDAN